MKRVKSASHRCPQMAQRWVRLVLWVGQCTMLIGARLAIVAANKLARARRAARNWNKEVKQ